MSTPQELLMWLRELHAGAGKIGTAANHAMRGATARNPVSASPRLHNTPRAGTDARAVVARGRAAALDAFDRML